MKNLVFILFVSVVLWGCQTKYSGVPDDYITLLDTALVNAGDNAGELLKALNEAPDEQKEGMAFLISYMPKRDLIYDVKNASCPFFYGEQNVQDEKNRSPASFQYLLQNLFRIITLTEIRKQNGK